MATTNGFADEVQDPSANSPWLDPTFLARGGAGMTYADGTPISIGGASPFQETLPGGAPSSVQTFGADTPDAQPNPDPSQQSPWLSDPSATPPATTPAPAATPPAAAQPNAGPASDAPGGDQTGTPGTYTPPTYTPTPENTGVNSMNFVVGGNTLPHVQEYQTFIDQLAGKNGGTSPEQRAVILDQLGQKVQSDLEADGHKVTWNKSGQMVVDGRTYDLGVGLDSGPNVSSLGQQLSTLRGLAPGTGTQPAPPGGGGDAGAPNGGGATVPNPDVPPWLSNAPTYQPSQYLDTELAGLPNFSDLYAQASAPTPHEAELDSLVRTILQHPESLSEQDVATLKAKAAENAAVAGQAQDEELQHFGFGAGLADSPWLAGQRANNAWNRRNTTIQADQNVDIAAADRRAADQRSAASLGTSYASYQSGRKQAAVTLALDGALAKFGEQRNRTQLNASMDQAAAQSGQSKAQLIASYVLGATGQAIDVEKLNQQGSQFMQDLAYRVSQLKQQSDQFDAQMQLALQQFQHSKDNDAWTQAQQTYAA